MSSAGPRVTIAVCTPPSGRVTTAAAHACDEHAPTTLHHTARPSLQLYPFDSMRLKRENPKHVNGEQRRPKENCGPSAKIKHAGFQKTAAKGKEKPLDKQDPLGVCVSRSGKGPALDQSCGQEIPRAKKVD